MIIRAAKASDAPELSQLAMRSKAHWGYDQTFMQQVEGELTYQPAQLLNNPTFVAVEGDQMLGFYQLIRLDRQRSELEAMFVDPEYLAQGIGQRLFDHMVRHGRSLGVAEVVIQSDPFAEGFYLHLGCERIGSRSSGSIPGRELPLLSFQLMPAND